MSLDFKGNPDSAGRITPTRASQESKELPIENPKIKMHKLA